MAAMSAAMHQQQLVFSRFKKKKKFFFFFLFLKIRRHAKMGMMAVRQLALQIAEKQSDEHLSNSNWC